MSTFTRRSILRSTAFASVVGMAGIAVSAHAVPVLQMPMRPMVLVRRLERSLRDGERLVVTRQWQIEFARQGRGIAIAGHQIAAEVDAPAKLKPLADIEEARSTDGMFPIILSDDGEILGSGHSTRQEDVDAAIATARELIAKSGVTASTKAERQRHLAQFQQAGASLLDRMPTDLFFPRGEPVSTVRKLTLPDGSVGEFEVSYSAHSAPDGAWLERAERTIVTRIGDDEQHSSEAWSLTEQ